MWLFVLFIVVPLIEIALFIQIGGWLTLWPTIAIVIATAILGTALVRRQGVQTLGQVQAAIDRLDNPAAPLAHGAMILFAGALLLTPGFLTDAVGFALLVPAVRVALMRLVLARVQAQARAAAAAQGGPGRRSARAGGVVIDAEFYEVDAPPERPGPRRDADADGANGSGWTRH